MNIASKSYSLEPDIDTGQIRIIRWKPKLKVVGPIPLNFDNDVTDKIVQQLTSFDNYYKQRVIYLGIRPLSSFKMHQELAKEYKFKYEHLYNVRYANINAFFRKFHSKFITNKMPLFKGNNPTIDFKKEIMFDSIFEGGNLDAAIKVNNHEYDIFMRIDANTRGHLSWYYFRVMNGQIKGKIKLNICNFRRFKTLYQRNMKPYVKECESKEWKQGGHNVKFQTKKLRYKFLVDQFFQHQYTYNCLSFQYIFNQQNQQVQFAYCPPYSYSNLIKFISSLKQKVRRQPINSRFINFSILCQSLSGLQIPILTITNPQVQEHKKKIILISGRIHPGQSNGSHMIQGFIEELNQKQKQTIDFLSRVIIKIIPMINPDGVVIGNFRTSISGRDLNRTFKMKYDVLFPEVKYLKNLVFQTRKKLNNNILMFLDFHGHSVKKNVFFYGNQFPIYNPFYYKTRILGKLLSIMTPMFRFYSCIYRISESKRTTGRAVLSRYIHHCYTIEASNSCFYNPQQKKDIEFNISKWKEMGKIIVQSLEEFFQLEKEEEENMKARNQKKRKRIKEIYKDVSIKKKQKIKRSSKGINLENQQEQIKCFKITLPTNRTNEIINQIKEDEANKLAKQTSQDNLSEGGSDSQSQSNDFDQNQMIMFHKQISQFLDQFRANFSQNYIKKYHLPSENNNKSRIEDKKQEKNISIIPCMRDQMFKYKINSITRYSIRNQNKRQTANNVDQKKIQSNNKSIVKNISNADKKLIKKNSVYFNSWSSLKDQKQEDNLTIQSFWEGPLFPYKFRQVDNKNCYLNFQKKKLPKISLF